MRRWIRPITGLLVAYSAHASDPLCPSYPAATRVEADRTVARERAFAYYSASHRRAGPVASSADNVNFVDDHIFSKLATDSVEPAPLSSDAEFLRRATLDLTGRVPTPADVRAFLADESAGKRAAKIDALIASEAFTDYWTLYFARRFQVTSEYYTYIGIPGRTQFHRYLRNAIAENRPLDRLARELLTGVGDTHANGAGNWTMRAIQFNDPIQDTWDELTNRTTSQFLGVQSQCISCHDGRRHLEQINVWLTAKRREDFWRQSAFFSRLNILEVPVDAYSTQFKGVLTDRSSGGYNGVLANPLSPGPRPARSGGTYNAQYLFSGEIPRVGAWRMELARIVTSDRQFARAQVNYLWAHFFRSGIVDPPDGWDLARLDPAKLLEGATLQPTHPALLEELADRFIASGYDLRVMVRLLAVSRAYQLSSRRPGPWRPEFESYFAKHKPRRLTADELYDALAISTRTEVPMYVDGLDKPVLYAHQLPDPSEPRRDGGIHQILRIFGRGDWVFQPAQPRSSALQVLYFMNEPLVNFRTFGNRAFSPSSLLAQLLASDKTDEAMVEEISLATLGRKPTEAESQAALKVKRFPRQDWLSDVLWAFLNKADFWFNH